MSDKKQGEAEQPSNNIVWIIALSIILNVALGSFIYSILREVLGFNDDYASLTSIAICIFLAYKYFKHNEKDKATDKNTESKQQESHRGFTYREIHDIPEKENNNKHKNTVFNENELNQKELDRYISKNHSKEEIGLFYERYVGYVFEKKGWHVIYHGAKKRKAR
ncbi:hypothetical protein [Psychrobacter sp. JCM 18900]|uniref:hypothetical protein n=1 Tax=Psychrobacter sp. JCM 18900 TaxID=1298608 RepID=UPI0021C308EB|nr:hypothetical protein [Psychrobacter sp. JCM 18900]